MANNNNKNNNNIIIMSTPSSFVKSEPVSPLISGLKRSVTGTI